MSNECAICCEELCENKTDIIDTVETFTATVCLPCGHIYHKVCLLRWSCSEISNNKLQNSSDCSCPICRVSYNSKSIMEQKCTNIKLKCKLKSCSSMGYDCFEGLCYSDYLIYLKRQNSDHISFSSIIENPQNILLLNNLHDSQISYDKTSPLSSVKERSCCFSFCW